MALFSSGNRKVRSRRPKTATELGRAPAPQLTKPRQLQRQASRVNEEIHRLECLIADAPRLQKAHRLATLDILPPMESAPTASRRKKKLTLSQKSVQNSRRLSLAMEWLVVLGGIAALAGWIHQWMHH
ncbi:MAG: hypothetical protein IPK32_21310 [Verrucomicrobiaceae bacterium]|nr:hypothetical protein [Verrucomicrobiaceae bacterium]